MKDIVEQLRWRTEPACTSDAIWDQAADEIERLRVALQLSHRAIEMTGHRLDELEAEVARLREILRR